MFFFAFTEQGREMEIQRPEVAPAPAEGSYKLSTDFYFIFIFCFFYCAY